MESYIFCSNVAKIHDHNGITGQANKKYFLPNFVTEGLSNNYRTSDSLNKRFQTCAHLLSTHMFDT